MSIPATKANRRSDPRFRLAPQQAQDAIEDILDLNLETPNPTGLYRSAFELAFAHKLPTIYDGMYVALAAELQAQLWTADQRLLKALRDAFPFVRPLAEFTL